MSPAAPGSAYRCRSGYKKSLQHGPTNMFDNKQETSSRILPSQYHQNFQPMAKGVRVELWQEGWNQRNERKKNGFNHFKLEWIVPTDRSVGRRKKPPERGLQQKYYTPRTEGADGLHELLEPLSLSPTKLEEKRTKLFRMYERREKKRVAAQLEQAKKQEEAMGRVVDSHGNPVTSPKLSDYEKNKLNNGKSHIDLPTCSSSGFSTLRLDQNPSATARGTNP